MLLYGDMSPQILDNFSILINEIFAPLLTNLLNRIDWPNELKDDIATKFHDLTESVAVVKGKLNHKTFLPLPLNMSEVLVVGQQIVEG